MLPGVDAEVLMIPLVGHSRGHTGVAVRDGEGWLLHCGDAYFHRGQMEPEPDCPRGAADVPERDGRRPLGAAARTSSACSGWPASRTAEVRIFCAHDPVELEKLAS